MKKTLLLGAACLALLANLSLGCIPQASGPKPIQDKVTLSFLLPSAYQHFYDDQLEKFKTQEPNITVKLLTQGYGGQQSADVVLINGYQLDQPVFQDTNAALDLTPLLQQDSAFNKDDYFPGALETFQRQGKLMALPTGIDPEVIFYNQDLFDRMGAAYPQPGWTWEQFRLSAQQVTDVPQGIFGYRPAQGYFDCLFFVFQNGGALYDDQQNPKLDGPETVRAVEWYTSLFGPDGPAASEEQMLDAYDVGRGDVGVVTAKIGMWMGNVSSLSRDFGGMIKFRVGMAPLPRGDKGISLAQFQGLIITAKTVNPQASWRLVSFLAQQPNTWVYPARKSLAESPLFLSAFGKDQAAGVRAAIENSTQVSGMNFARYNTVMLSFSMAVTKSIHEGIPAALALKEAQDDFQK